MCSHWAGRMSLSARSPRALTHVRPYVLSVGVYAIHLHVRALSGALSFELLIEMCWFVICSESPGDEPVNLKPLCFGYVAS